jgi:carbon monoxide dehydrogenase subunit G
MAPIVESIEIARRPEDVFQYVTDPEHVREWQASVVNVKKETEGPVHAGSKVVVTRRIGRRDRPMKMEFAELTPPRHWAIRGVDGPIRGNVDGTVEPVGEGGSRVTLSLDFEGHGIGKVLVPLMVRRMAQKEVPRNLQTLKQKLESGS